MFGLLAGYALIFFSFGVGGFDVLPDFLGYFLVFRCLDRLCYKSDSFRRARPLALGMTAVALLSALLPLFIKGSLANIVKTAAVVLSLGFFYLIVKGIEEIEKVESMDLRSQKLKKAWIVFSLSQLICTFIPVGESTGIKLILTLGAVGSVVFALVILVYLYMAKVTYDYVEAPIEEKAKHQKKLSRKKRKQAKK